MAEYCVGGAFRPDAAAEVEWIGANRPDLQPVRVTKTGDPHVRLVITIDAADDDNAQAKAEDAFQKAARSAGVAGSAAGGKGMNVWLASESSPPNYQPD